MTSETAFAVFSELERCRMEMFDDEEQNPPTYDVRLDAVSNRDDGKRRFRLRVTAGRESGGLELDDWQHVLAVAEQHELTNVVIANDGIELS